jgi:ABC-2 type transport system permease protein
MKQLFVFIRKEFYHIFRDPKTLAVMFGLPVVLITLLGMVVSNEVRDIRIVISDYAKDAVSERLVGKIKTSEYFIVEEELVPPSRIEKKFQEGNTKVLMYIPAGFQQDLGHYGKATIQLLLDGTEPNNAKTIGNYLTAIMANMQQEISPMPARPYNIVPEMRMLYNESGDGRLNSVPGIMALVLMLVCTTLPSVAVVKEKEMGTMEVLLVSPFRPILVLIAKAIPYLIVSIVVFIIILVASVNILGVQIKGSLVLLLFETTLFILCSLSLGLLISNSTSSQQTALLISLMGMLLPTVILTGFLIPLENMPRVFQYLANVLPSRWYFLSVKAVMLKGLGWESVWEDTLIMLGMALFLLWLALKRFKIRL